MLSASSDSWVQGVGFEALEVSFSSSLSFPRYSAGDVKLMIVIAEFPFEESDGLMRISYCKFLFCQEGASNLEFVGLT